MDEKQVKTDLTRKGQMTEAPKKAIVKKAVMVPVIHNSKEPIVKVVLEGGKVNSTERGGKIALHQLAAYNTQEVKALFSPTVKAIMEKMGCHLVLSDAYGQLLTYSASANSVKQVIGYNVKDRVLVINKNRFFDYEALMATALKGHNVSASAFKTYYHVAVTQKNCEGFTQAIKAFFKG